MSAYRIAINECALSGKLPPGDPQWATFNDRFVNQEIVLIDFANAIYTGHAYTTWHEGRRSLETFSCGQHIAVDLDSEDERSDIGQLYQHDFVRTYGSLLHTTPSHTVSCPRCRIVFLLDQPIASPDAYTAAARFLASMFAGADTAATDASRFFYGSTNCQIELPGKILPLNHLRHYYRRNKPATPSPARTKPAPRIELPPESELSLIADAIQHIDPWSVDYGRWIGILAALKRELGDAALPLAQRWASGKPNEVDREWSRLKEERGRAMSLGTIYWLAQQNGWQRERRH